jgi:predicted NAD-dependent protein-ADP-ribosyltransferase YbiA (DUF1768 family)
MKVAFRMDSPNLLETLGFSTEAEDTETPETAETETPETPKTETPKAETPETPKAEIPKEEKPRKKRERLIPIPTDSASFFRVRAKNVERFQFTADGNLQVPQMRGEPPKVIELPFYRPATIDEIVQEEEKQTEQLRATEREFDETFKLLKSAILEWRTTGNSSDVIKYQRDLQRLDAERTQLRSPIRWTKEFKNLSINRILLEEFYEKRKLGYSVLALQTLGLPYEKTIIASSTKPVNVVVELEETDETVQKEEEEFILFSSPTDPEHGFLSPETMVEFIYNSTKYNCLYQAYEGERLSMLGRQDIRPILLKSRSPRQMRVITSRVVGQVEAPRELLINILKSLISQHPNFADNLRTTGTSTLVYTEPKDGVLGIGMSQTDPEVTEKASWKGKNFLGQAWMAVRTGLPKEEEAEEEELPVQEGGYTEHGTTLVEAKEKRTKVLMGKYKHKKAFA